MGKLSPYVTKIAVKSRDIKVPYGAKKALVRPILIGLRDVILMDGDVNVTGFGRFYIYRRRVTKSIGSREKKMMLTVGFRPHKSFMKLVEGQWNEKMELGLEKNSQESTTSVGGSDGAPAQSVGGGESKVSSVASPTVEDTSTTKIKALLGRRLGQR